MSQSNLRDFYDRYIAALNAREFDIMNEFIHHGVTLNGKPTTRDDILDVLRHEAGSVPDLHWVLTNLIIDGDRLGAQQVNTGASEDVRRRGTNGQVLGVDGISRLSGNRRPLQAHGGDTDDHTHLWRLWRHGPPGTEPCAERPRPLENSKARDQAGINLEPISSAGMKHRNVDAEVGVIFPCGARRAGMGGVIQVALICRDAPWALDRRVSARA